MKHLIPLLALLAACGGSGGASSISSGDEAAKQAAKALEEGAAILGAVKDRAMAEAAKPKLMGVAKRLGEIAAATMKLSPSGETSKSAETMTKGLEAWSEAIMRYMEAGAGNVLDEPLGLISSHVMQLRGALGG